MRAENKLLTILSDAEHEALYGLPDFDDAQRLEYLALSETELAFASSRPSLHAQVYCILQIGYFKAKHAFFRFDWNEVKDDSAFVLSRYFHGEAFEHKEITKHEHYTQRERITELFGYRSWVAKFLPQLAQQAAQIVRRDTLQTTAQRMSVKPVSKLTLRWQAVDGLAERIRRHLRPLYVALDFAGTDPDSLWLVALAWVKEVFSKQQRLSQRPLAECPATTLPKRLRPFLLTSDADGKPTSLHADRYEFWLYRQVRKRFQSGELYLDDSLQHRHFSDELVSMEEKADALAQMDIPFLRQPIDAQLDVLASELHTQWLAFNRELEQGKLTHLEYDKATQKLTWRKPRGENQKEREKAFYEQLPFCDVADVFRFVNGQCQFLATLTPRCFLQRKGMVTQPFRQTYTNLLISEQICC